MAFTQLSFEEAPDLANFEVESSLKAYDNKIVLVHNNFLFSILLDNFDDSYFHFL